MKFSILSLLLLALLSIDLCQGQSKVMKEYHRSFSGKRTTRDAFVKRFPYDRYLNSVEFTDFKTLQSDREYVYRNFGEGDIFLYSLGDYFIQHYPVGIDDLEKKIDIGELYLSDKRRSHGFNRSKNEIYTIMGYFILGRVAQTLEEQISSGKVNEKNLRIRQIIQRLKNNKIFVSTETSTLDKLVQNLQKGNVAYVWDRILLKVQAYVGHIPAYIILGLLLLVAYFFIFKKTRYFSMWLLGGVFLLGLTCFLVKKYSRGNSPVIASSSQATPLRPPKYYLDNKYFYHKEGGKHRMMVFGIENEEGREIGQSIWLGRPRMKANYFAYQNVPQKFHQHSRRRQVVMAATAGFTNSEGQPEGLTVEAGNIVNAVIMHDRHGLVIVESFGGLRVINLKRKSIRLPVSRKQSLTIANPLHSLPPCSTGADNEGLPFFRPNYWAMEINCSSIPASLPFKSASGGSWWPFAIEKAKTSITPFSIFSNPTTSP